MDSTLVSILVTALVTIVCAAIVNLPNILISWATLKKARMIDTKQDENTQITKDTSVDVKATSADVKALDGKADTIGEQTNGTLSALKAELATTTQQLTVALQQNRDLQASIIQLLSQKGRDG